MEPDRLESHRLASNAGNAQPFEDAVRAHCNLILRSPHFDASERSRKFLRFILDETLGGRGEHLSQSSIAMAVFGRDGNFDAVMDPIVRVQAGRLRRSLERFYLLNGNPESFHLVLPKGKYSPTFVETELAEPAKGEVNAQEPDDRPTLLILPLETASGVDAESAARLKDELATELSRYGTVRVIRKRDADCGQNLTPRFELRGSLRRAGKDSQVRTSLVDKESGIQLWSDEFHTHAINNQWSSSLDDIARVIAAHVGDEHGIVLRQVIREHKPNCAAGSPPMGAILRGHHFFFTRQVGDLVPAINALQRLTVGEPENPQAWTQLARLRLANYAYELSDLSTPIESTIACACQGLLLDPLNARATSVLAEALLIKGELRAARDKIEQALRHNGDSLVYREVLGWLLTLCGEWDRGMAVVRDAASRNPYCLQHVQHALWADHLRRGEFDRAYIAALEYRDESGFWPQLMAACCLGNLGRVDEAQVPLLELLAAKPDFAVRGRRLVGYLIKSADIGAAIEDGLLKAGLQIE